LIELEPADTCKADTFFSILNSFGKFINYKKEKQKGLPKKHGSPMDSGKDRTAAACCQQPQFVQKLLVQQLLAGIELLVLGLALLFPLLAILVALGKAYDLIAHNDALEFIFVGTIGCARSGIGNHA